MEHLGVTILAENNDGEECYQNLYSELNMSAAGLDNNSINARQGLDHNKKEE